MTSAGIINFLYKNIFEKLTHDTYKFNYLLGLVDFVLIDKSQLLGFSKIRKENEIGKDSEKLSVRKSYQIYLIKF